MVRSGQSAAPDDAVTRAVDAFRRIVRAVRLSACRAERGLGLSGAQLFVLQQLGASSVRSLNELAERTRTHQSSVSVVVRRLVERGLVTRTRPADDTRRVALGLSKAGRALLRRFPPVAQIQLIRAIAGLSPSQRRALASTLELVVRRMGLAASPASMMYTDADQLGPSAVRPAKRSGRGRPSRRSRVAALGAPL
ncbi:MAG: MarR family winged helix-turn-helix transcriptional regulator [Gemmatimonadales bacterium]